VNVASRVEGACKEVGYDIVVADSTRNGAPDFAFLEAGSIQLKGKSQRVRVHILVGDPELARSGAFKLLRHAHGEALAALRDGRDPMGPIAECMALAARIEPGLERFYGLLQERREDIVVATHEAEAAE
jgi:adenylate cyclase